MSAFKRSAVSVGTPDMSPPDVGSSIGPISLHNAIGWAHVIAGSNQGNSTTGSHRKLRNMDQLMCSPTHRTGWLLPKGRERNPGPLHDFRFVRIGKTVLYVGLPGHEPGTSSLSETKACVPAVHCCSKNAA